MTYLEAKQELARLLDISWSDIASNALISQTDLEAWLQTGIKRGWDYKPWDFSEGAKTYTITASDITNGYIDYPTDFQSGSINMMFSSAEENPFVKLIFQDYQKFRNQYPSEDDLVYSEYKRWIFINPNAIAAGDVVDFYGKLKAPTPSNDADLMPFSPDVDNMEYSGNQAIVLLAYGEALTSDKKKDPNKARLEEKRAYEILDLIWQPFADSRALLQSKNKPFFNVPDFYA